ncbi:MULTISPECIES: CHAT domain-containing protein [unclassified Streptomyces]|uniref:CHAT domain-containing protein n=1 Tax=unclassified Streptomyces TaxID=2593676 RepID=UPI0037A78F78
MATGGGEAARQDVYREIEESALALVADFRREDPERGAAARTRFAQALDARPRESGDLTGTSCALRAAVRRVADPETRRVTHRGLASLMLVLTLSSGDAEDMSGLLGLWTDVPVEPGQEQQRDLGTGVVAVWLPHAGRFLRDDRFSRRELFLMMGLLLRAYREEGAASGLRQQVIDVFPAMMSAWFTRESEVTADELTGAIEVLAGLVEELPPDEESTHILMMLLSAYHVERGRRSGLRVHADLAVDGYAHVAARSGPGLRAHLRFSLGAAEYERYRSFGERPDLDASIEHLAQSRAETGEEDREQGADHLLIAGLSERARLDDSAEDILAALRIWPAPAAVDVDGSVLPGAVLDGLASDLTSAAQAVVLSLDPERPEDVTTLGRLWDAAAGWIDRSDDRVAGPLLGPLHWQARMAHHQFSLTHALAALDRCVAALRAASGRSEEGSAKAQFRGEAAVAHLERYGYTGLASDLDESIAAQHDYLAAQNDPLRQANGLSNLSSALMLRAEATGSHEDLDASVAAMRDALALDNGDQLGAHGLHFADNLVSKLIARCDRLGTVSDLDEALTLGEAAVAGLRALEGAAAAERLGVALSNLGGAHRYRFEALRREADLDAALEALRGAVAAVPPEHPHHTRYLFNLGSCLTIAHRHGRETLEEALAHHRAAVRATAADHPGRARRVASLSSTLLTRWARTGDEQPAEEALSLLRQVHDDPRNSAEGRLDAAHALAAALRETGLRHADEAALREAVRLDAEVAGASTGAVTRRIVGAERSALLTERLDGPAAALPGWERTVELLSQVAWRGLSRMDQERSLVGWSGAGRSAAACALDAGEGRRAVELLEQGRSVLWTQSLESRAEDTPLDHADPELATELRQVGAALEAATAGQAWHGPEEPARQPSVDQQVLLGRRWDVLVERATGVLRGESPFHGVGYDELAEAAADGPVILVNLAPRRCDALIVRHGRREPLIVPLGLILAEAAERAEGLHDALRALEAGRSSAEGYVHAQMVLADTLDWLWERVVRPVLDALGFAEPVEDPGAGAGPAERPRVWWCPTGPLTLLPLHAAAPGGVGTDDGSLRRTIPSYTSTVRGLRRARTREPGPAAEGQQERVLTVATPATPGYPPLAHAAEEATAAASVLADRLGLGSTTLVGEDATRRRVREGLERCSRAHFACHGGRQEGLPSSSSLQLHDGPLTVLDIARQRLAHADLAFLSACSTAVGDATLQDEALHVAAGLQLAGFREVVGTLWSVTDDHAVDIARQFYGALGNGTGAAEAIVEAAEHMRRRFPLEPVRWAGYLHFGP